MTPLESAITNPSYRCLPGRCVIQFDAPPTMAGLIHIPSTVDQGPKVVNRDKAWTGIVLFMTSRAPSRKCSTCSGSGTANLANLILAQCPCTYEDFEVGDRVICLLTAADLDQRTISTLNTRIYAVIESD